MKCIFGDLIKLAHKVGNAKKYGTKEEIEKAEKELKYYAKLCLASDGLILDVKKSLL